MSDKIDGNPKKIFAIVLIIILILNLILVGFGIYDWLTFWFVLGIVFLLKFFVVKKNN